MANNAPTEDESNTNPTTHCRSKTVLEFGEDAKNNWREQSRSERKLF